MKEYTKPRTEIIPVLPQTIIALSMPEENAQ